MNLDVLVQRRRGIRWRDKRRHDECFQMALALNHQRIPIATSITCDSTENISRLPAGGTHFERGDGAQSREGAKKL